MAHHDALTALREIDKFFKMKEGSIGDPGYYLGAKLRKTTLKNGVEAWAMSSSKYALAAVANVVDQLKSRGQEHMMPKSAANPFKGGYKPEMDGVLSWTLSKRPITSRSSEFCGGCAKLDA
jgi:hypothetical protein